MGQNCLRSKIAQGHPWCSAGGISHSIQKYIPFLLLLLLLLGPKNLNKFHTYVFRMYSLCTVILLITAYYVVCITRIMKLSAGIFFHHKTRMYSTRRLSTLLSCFSLYFLSGKTASISRALTYPIFIALILYIINNFPFFFL